MIILLYVRGICGDKEVIGLGLIVYVYIRVLDGTCGHELKEKTPALARTKSICFWTSCSGSGMRF